MPATEATTSAPYTALTRSAFALARRLASDQGHDFVTNGDVLAALAKTPGLGRVLLKEAGISSTVVHQALRRAGIGDAEALNSIGIDLTAIKACVEDSLGPGVLDTSTPTFTELAIDALSLARDEAVRLTHDFVGTEHVLLGLLRQDEGAPRELLARHGMELAGLRDVIAERVARVVAIRRAVNASEHEQALHRLIDWFSGLSADTQAVAKTALDELWAKSLAAWGALLEHLGDSTDAEVVHDYVSQLGPALDAARAQLSAAALTFP